MNYVHFVSTCIQSFVTAQHKASEWHLAQSSAVDSPAFLLHFVPPRWATCQAPWQTGMAPKPPAQTEAARWSNAYEGDRLNTLVSILCEVNDDWVKLTLTLTPFQQRDISLKGSCIHNMLFLNLELKIMKTKETVWWQCKLVWGHLISSISLLDSHQSRWKSIRLTQTEMFTDEVIYLSLIHLVVSSQLNKL